MQRSTAWNLALEAANVVHAARSAHQLAVTELLLFGSLARKTRGDVGDVDLLILQPNTVNIRDCDLYYDDGDDFDQPPFPEDWPVYYGCNDHGKQRTLHKLVFPTAVITDHATQNTIAARQSDPHFLRNCFSAMCRYDWRQRRFVPINHSYFEHRYGAKLTELC
ncbi:MAG: nucleotidyltransferase domain-containing protein [Candidatus Andersenbacteria bacterium]